MFIFMFTVMFVIIVIFIYLYKSVSILFNIDTKSPWSFQFDPWDPPSLFPCTLFTTSRCCQSENVYEALRDPDVLLQVGQRRVRVH